MHFVQSLSLWVNYHPMHKEASLVRTENLTNLSVMGVGVGVVEWEGLQKC